MPAEFADDLTRRIYDEMKKHLVVGGHEAWEGSYHYVNGMEKAACAVRALLNSTGENHESR